MIKRAKAFLLVLGLTVAAIGLLPAPLHAQGLIHACVNTTNGTVRIVGSSTPCKINETRVMWNGTGGAGTIVGNVALQCTPGSDMARTLVYVPGHAFTVYTGPDGAFQIESIPAGTYDIVIERNGQVLAQVSDVVVNLAVNNGLVNLNTVNLDNLQTDPANCGTCGTACPNGFACTAGACTPPPCLPNQMSCDGACVDVTNNLNNCGACGVVCPGGPNATAACAASQCTTTCLPGFASCDGQSANGCEINTATSVANCGGCGLQCLAGQSCVAGACTGPVAECTPATVSACPLQLGVCAGSQRTCQANGTWGACNLGPNYSTVELCDNLDNNCNGLFDETFSNLGGVCEAGGVIGTVVCNAAGNGVVCRLDGSR